MAITGWEMADLVREVCYDTGAGPLVLGGALAGYRDFAGVVSAGARFPYAIVGVTDPGQWETGIGMLDGEGRLEREALASSAGGAAVDFAAGEKRVGLALHAGWADAVEGHGHSIGAVEGLGEALAGKQAASATLSALAGVATAAFGRGVLGASDAAAFRAYIGAGTSSSAGTVTSVAMSGGTTGLSVSGGPVTGAGTLTLGGTLGIASGGTGATSAAAARTALGLGGCATLDVGAAAGTVAAGNDGRFADALSKSGGTQEIRNNASLVINGGSSPITTASGFGNVVLYNNAASILGIIADGNQAGLRCFAHGGLTNNRFVRREGTYAAPTDIASGAVIGDLNFWGYIGGADQELARIRTTLTSTAPTPTNKAARMGFYVGRDGSSSSIEVVRIDYNSLDVQGSVVPRTDNGFNIGSASLRWATIFAATGSISTSDARAKREIGPLPEALLDAWGDVGWRGFRFADAFAAKGAAARQHAGLIAQEVRDAIDGRLGEGAAVRWGLLCHDGWDAAAEERDEDGAILNEARPAGERWGLRYEECLAVEAAWQRRRMHRIEARLAVLEGAGDAG